ncbi:MAG: helix-turn-helix transcriptional regulator, partial [Pseudomonadota bacterium]
MRGASDQQFLQALGERSRDLRARSGITRKALAQTSGLSERHLANLESGEGNPSVLRLAQVAEALHCPLAELLGDVTTSSPEWLSIRSLLAGCDETTLRRVRQAISGELGNTSTRARRLALIGLRGAGKSTLGARLAAELGVAYVELSREIEAIAACGVGEIRDLYGAEAYRRYERQALEAVIERNDEVVLATPGGLVSDPQSFDYLLANTTAIWLRATPQDHMQRVMAQGDYRPMAGNNEAMNDLKHILGTREPFYCQAPLQLDTSAQSLDATYASLSAQEAEALLGDVAEQVIRAGDGVP